MLDPGLGLGVPFGNINVNPDVGVGLYAVVSFDVSVLILWFGGRFLRTS